jgi:hypothetical protein
VAHAVPLVVGAGGKNHDEQGTVKAIGQVRNCTTNGVLSLTLHDASYEWRFVPAGDTFTDTGSQRCH